MYKVIKAFHDLQDVKKTKSGEIYFEYRVGDTYPRKGLSPSEDRIAELAGDENKQGTPLIELVGKEQDAESMEEQTVEDKPGVEDGQQEELAEVSEKPATKKTASKKRSTKVSEK